ncbi:MAG: hybrid sensor histidine kinase/response regulator [Geitlerinemataceae cyanobacterium]
MLVTNLNNFISRVPAFAPTETLDRVLELVGCQNGDLLAIVDGKQYPLAVVYFHRLLLSLRTIERSVSACPVRIGGERTTQQQQSIAPETVFLSALDPSIFAPLAIIPVDLTLEQLFPYLQDSPPNSAYAIVDAENQFLGLLDLWGLLQSLVQQRIATPQRSDLTVVQSQYQQLARELAAKNADLEQIGRLKNELLAAVSHELKTPLSSVSSLSSLLKNPKMGQLSDRQAQYADLIYQSSRQLIGVVNRVSELSRIENGELELRRSSVEISPCCDRAYRQALQLSDSPGETSFTLEIASGLNAIVADEFRLCQILVNLLSNALKFTPSTQRIGLRVSQWGRWIAFTVWDTGVGIADRDQSLIFQRFQRLENPLTHQFEGTGLGLVLAQRLARLQGGEITFTSQEGRGSEFTLLLPFVESLEVRDRPTKPDRKKLILVVESDTPAIESLTSVLKAWGYPVAIARSGTEAIEKVRQLQPQILLLNPNLPFLSGWDVLTLIKADKTTRHLRTIVMAAADRQQQAKLDGADDFLCLPWQEEQLHQVVSYSRPPSRANSGKLTIMWLTSAEQDLSPKTLKVQASQKLRTSIAQADLNGLFHQHNCRILEVDDLEQANMLARIWKPDVVLFDSLVPFADPVGYLNELAQSSHLADLPLVTIDPETTQAANQVSQTYGGRLQVFPCFSMPETCQADDPECNVPALLQAIQLAVGMGNQ